jgi:hypothetical protein
MPNGWNAAARLPESCSHLGARHLGRVFAAYFIAIIRNAPVVGRGCPAVDQSGDGERSLLCWFFQDCIIAMRGYDFQKGTTAAQCNESDDKRGKSWLR